MRSTERCRLVTAVFCLGGLACAWTRGATAADQESTVFRNERYGFQIRLPAGWRGSAMNPEGFDAVAGTFALVQRSAAVLEPPALPKNADLNWQSKAAVFPRAVSIARTKHPNDRLIPVDLSGTTYTATFQLARDGGEATRQPDFSDLLPLEKLETLATSSR